MSVTVDSPSHKLSIELLLFADRRPSGAELLDSVAERLDGLDGDFDAKLKVVDIVDFPYWAEHYKLVATPALVKTYPLPPQVLVGNDIDSQLELWWPRWQDEMQVVAAQGANPYEGSLEQTAEMLRLSEEVFQLRQHQAELEEQLLFKDRILAMLAHDLRNPLSATSMAVETLEQHLDTITPELKAQLFQHARTQTRHMEQMIVDILEAARGTAAELALSTAEVQLADLCREAIAEIGDRAAAKELVVEIDVPAVLPTVHADCDKIRQVLMNLLDNAIKYTPKTGTIAIAALHRTRQKVEVSITDTGPGIPKEARERIFTDTVRLSRDRDRAGYGIGLSLCQRIIRAHYGRIWVDSSPGEGSCFHFTLPVYRV